ncbi:MAG: GIY-YIG nuclease family protein [Candidatus Paceibacter sp.]|nr:GIY-YIG nuclease family protein [Candidatus Paceibacter sp.]
MFYYTYILKSLKDRKMYTGFTRNLKLRFEQHNQGLSQSTKSRKPFKLIYYEACLDKKDAMKREKYFKTHFGKMFLKNRLKSYLTGGFTLLMSLLVISIILSIGLGVSDVIIRETKISGLGRESQVAFSAADAGVECAFFWEIKHPGLTQSAFNSANSVSCAGNTVNNNFSTNISNFTLNLGNSSCVSVKVDKASSPTQTIIESRGYNTDCGAVSPFKVERAIRLTLNKVQPPVTLTFNYTGDYQTFVVPTGVNNIKITAYGAEGRGALTTCSGNSKSIGGGFGGVAQAAFTVTPNEKLYVYVGGSGDNSSFNGGAANGTGNPSGGGASDVRRITGNNKSALESRIIVAGGGGGSTGYCAGSDDIVILRAGGAGGGLYGLSGEGYGGGGASQISGGSGGCFQDGFGKCIGNIGYSGTFGLGGGGGIMGGGGGGGGYYGGGGGSGEAVGNWNRGGGGGGSSYIDGSATDPSTQTGVNSGNGKVIIEYGY